MKYFLLWALLDIHSGDMDGPYQTDKHEWSAEQCAKLLQVIPIQKPDKDGKVKVFACINTAAIRPTIQYTEVL